MFLRAIDWFNKASKLFSRCFRLKIGLNEFLGEKKHEPCFKWVAPWFFLFSQEKV